MIENYLTLHKKINNQEIKFKNKTFLNIIQNYCFFYLSENKLIDNDEKQIINHNVKCSKIIVTHQNEQLNNETNKKLLIIGFDKTIIILDQSSISFLKDILDKNQDLHVFFISNTKNIIKSAIEINNQEIESDQNFIFETERLIKAFCLFKPTKIISQIWSFIVQCIASYLLQDSYLKHKKNRIEKFIKDIENNKLQETMEENEYVEIRNIGKGSIFEGILIYHIKRGELYLIKRPYVIDNEIPKLVEREKLNYMKINHPFLPKYYGTIKNKNHIVIEFIKGQSLLNMNKMTLSFDDKITIVFELMIIIKYFHDNELIYRDLKLDNVIIDENKNIVLIDFDRLISNNDDFVQTLNIGGSFIAPEISILQKFSYSSDIYSLGKMIEYIMFCKDKKNEENYNDYLKIEEITLSCMNENPNKRPNISNLIQEFNSIFNYRIQINNFLFENEDHLRNLEIIAETMKYSKLNPKSSHIQLNLGLIYERGKYVYPDINKAIHYYSLASNANNPLAQYNLGLIYETGKNGVKDIDKAIHYYNLASNQNNPQAQYNLGIIYVTGKNGSQDINKAIHYLSLAADQNIPEASYSFGLIYEKGKYVSRDIYKAIYYYSLASDQNYSQAQYCLGFIYHEGKYVSKDIKKAIHYYTLAADHNNSKAQTNLGVIYISDQYVSRDIQKSIHYFSLAANQNNTDAQFNLGLIYEKEEFGNQNIKKAIYYYSLAAFQNNSDAQYNLGYIYYEGKYITRDIDKAIQFFSLAANQNHPDASFNLGVIYETGLYIARDIKKAIEYYLYAVELNDSRSQYNLGLIYEKGIYVTRDINKAIHYFTLAANQSHSLSQLNLGIIYNEAKYIKQDINKAIHYFTLASENNNVNEQTNLGIIYEEGEYVPRDINKAIHYYTLAANQNYPQAQYKLGSIYESGKYINQDTKKAIYYYQLAADQNDIHALICLGFIYSKGDYVTRDINQAIHYYTLAANQNNLEAQFNLGIIFSDGNYVPKDIDKAINYFILAANQSFPKTQFNLGFIYEYIKQDIDKAIHYYSLAADQNISEANCRLGLIYLSSKYNRQDINKGIHYLTLASNQSNAQAQYNLGAIYESGEYLPRNINKAIHYYSLSSKQNYSKAQLQLGLIYYLGNYFQKDIKKGLFLIIEASKNENRLANFAHGFLLHEGKNIRRDIQGAIHYYKEASSFNIQYAKNNLGIIYKNGFSTEISSNIMNSIIYFEEAIHQKNDYLAMYNLTHIYIYSEGIKKDINKTIDLLIRSAKQFKHSLILLCLVLIKQCDFKKQKIKQEIELHIEKENDLFTKIHQIINELNTYGELQITNLYEYYSKKYFLYNIIGVPFQSSDLESIVYNENIQKYPKAKDISSEFYNGFGLDLLI